MMGILASGGLAAGLGHAPQTLGQAAPVLCRQFFELDSHARGCVAVPTPGDPRHTAMGRQRLTRRQRYFQTQGFANFK